MWQNLPISLFTTLPGSGRGAGRGVAFPPLGFAWISTCTVLYIRNLTCSYLIRFFSEFKSVEKTFRQGLKRLFLFCFVLFYFYAYCLNKPVTYNLKRFMYKLYRHKLYREQIVSAQIVLAQFVSAQFVLDTNCIGHKLYRAQIESGTNCIGHKLYLVTN